MVQHQLFELDDDDDQQHVNGVLDQGTNFERKLCAKIAKRSTKITPQTGNKQACEVIAIG